PRRLLTFGMLGSGITSIVMGFSISYSIFAFSLAFNGLFQSTGWASNLKAMTPWFEPSSRGKVTGIWCTCYTVGSVMATAMTTWLLVEYSLDMAFIVPGILIAAVALLIYLFMIDSPEEAGFRSSGGEAVGVCLQKTKAPFMKMISNPTIITYGICYAFIKFIRYSFIFWLPWYLYDKMNFSVGDSGYISMACDIGGICGVVGIGMLSDKFFNKKRSRIVVICLLAVAGSLWLYQVFGSASIFINCMLLGLIGFMLLGGGSILSASATQDIGGNESTASAAGIVNGIGSIGGACGGVVPALIAESYGWNALFYLFIFTAIFAALILQFCVRHENDGT
ncbi:MAG: MFS transporter, partial [Lentisphaeraceae bacterium]|nr:MFS transporter [Lentisphaeraceae bacterium]